MRYVRPILLVCFSLLCIGSFYFTLSYFESRELPKVPIKIIAQTGPLKEGLKTDYLAEILELSANQPKSMEIEEVETILRESPLIKKVSASYLSPDTLYIDYTLRSPTFALIDLENVALDLEGYLFPLSPYFTPKKLPELYLGLIEVPPWSLPLRREEVALANHLYALLGKRVKRIDLSRSNENSLGRREMIVILEYPGGICHTLRLSPKRYEEELRNYQRFQKKVQDQRLIIDLRVPHLAYVATQAPDGAP